jgi:hypothetical protein
MISQYELMRRRDKYPARLAEVREDLTYASAPSLIRREHEVSDGEPFHQTAQTYRCMKPLCRMNRVGP